MREPICQSSHTPPPSLGHFCNSVGLGQSREVCFAPFSAIRMQKTTMDSTLSGRFSVEILIVVGKMPKERSPWSQCWVEECANGLSLTAPQKGKSSGSEIMFQLYARNEISDVTQVCRLGFPAWDQPWPSNSGPPAKYTGKSCTEKNNNHVRLTRDHNPCSSRCLSCAFSIYHATTSFVPFQD